MKESPLGAIGRACPSGWIQAHLFTDWFDDFIKKARPTRDFPVLIMDGHISHTINLDVVELVRNNHMRILSYPPQTVHKIQPLVCMFASPLKTHYTGNIRQHMYASQ